MQTDNETTRATANLTVMVPVKVENDPARYPGDKAHWTVVSNTLNLYVTDTHLDTALGRFVEAMEAKLTATGGTALTEGQRLGYFMSLRRQVLQVAQVRTLHEAKPWWEAAVAPPTPTPSLGSAGVLHPAAVWPGYYAAATAQALLDARTPHPYPVPIQEEPIQEEPIQEDDAKDDLDAYDEFRDDKASWGHSETITLADVRAMLRASDPLRVFNLDHVDGCLGAATLRHLHPSAIKTEWDNVEGEYQLLHGGTLYQVKGPELGAFLDWLQDRGLDGEITADVAEALLDAYRRRQSAEAVKAANEMFLTNADSFGWGKEVGTK